MYTGHVYLYDGTPLENIKVTDGLNISITDENGAYTLSGWDRANVISVGVLTLYHDDWFRYIDSGHSVYDFYISPIPKKDFSRFAHVSDTEIFLDNAKIDKWIDFARNTSKNEDCDFLIHTGDICRIRGLQTHYRELNYHTLGIPVRYTIGNHDYVNDKYGEYSFERLYGPIYYSFDHGGTHYVVLPIRKGETAGLYEPDDSVRWLKNDLLYNKCKQIVVFSHSFCHESEEDFVYGTSESVDLKEHGILAWIFGHLHTNFCNKTECGAFNISTARPDQGGIDLSPACIRITDVCGAELSTKLVYNENKYTDKISTFIYRKKLGDEFLFTSPIYADGRIYAVSSSDGYPKDAFLCALDSESGEIIYKKPLNYGTKTEPVYSDGRLFLLDTNGNLLCFDVKHGDVLWSVKLPEASPKYYKGGLLIDEGLLYVHGSLGLGGYSADDGKLMFFAETNGNGGTKSAKILKIDEKIVFPSQWGRFCVLDEQGNLLWDIPRIKDSLASPVADGRTVYVPSGRTLIKLSVDDGEIFAETEKYCDSAFDTPSKPLITDEFIFVSMSDFGVVAMDKDSLEIRKRYGVGESLIAICPYLDHSAYVAVGDIIAVTDKVIMFASCDGNIYFYDIYSEECIKKIKVGAPLTSTPIIFENKVGVVDFYGNFTAYEFPKIK